MAAATVNSGPNVDCWGRTTVVEVDVTWNTGDTCAFPDLGAVLWAEFITTTNASFGLTVATNVVTLASGGALTGKLIAYGNQT